MININLTPIQKVLVLTAAVSAILLGILALAPSPPGLDDKTLTDKALVAARVQGLAGEPAAQASHRMTYGEWLARSNSALGPDASQFGLTPDLPVFILVIRGNVEWTGPSAPPPPGVQNSRTDFNNMVVVLNALTGEVLQVHSYSPGARTPLPIP